VREPIEVAVDTAEAFEAYRHTLAALEEAFPVRFVTLQSAHAPQATLVMNPDREQLSGYPGPLFVVAGQPGRDTSSEVRFASNEYLGPVLRDRIVHDDSIASGASLVPQDGDRVLAKRVDPVWARRSRKGAAPIDLVAIPPPELKPAEHLQSHFRPGRWFALLPLIHFLRSLAPRSWRCPPLRACLVIDDPNLHRSTYGHLQFPALAVSARRNGYHASVATIPLDCWWVGTKASQVFRDYPVELSLSMHGNNHIYGEFSRPMTEEAALRAVSQALRRLDRLERKAGLSTSKVFVPPHDLLPDKAAMRALGMVGVHAVLVTDPTTRFPERNRFEPAAFSAEAFPLIRRFPLHLTPEAATLAAYLNQPIVIACHAQQAANGLSRFERAAAEVNSLGDIQWMSLEGIALTNFESRVDGDQLILRLFSRRVRVVVPSHISLLIVENGSPDGFARSQHAIVNGVKLPLVGGMSEPIEVKTKRLEVTIADSSVVDFREVKDLPVRVWPMFRRFLTEGRDRLRLPLRT
jgi:hypothetical protein